MKKLLTSMLVLGLAVTAGSLFGVFGKKGDGFEGGTGNINVPINDANVEIEQVIGDVLTFDYQQITQMCSGGAVCQVNLSSGQLNAVGDMYKIDFAFSPLNFGMITQEKNIVDPFNQSDTVYFTYSYNGMEFEVVLALLSSNRSDYTAAQWAMLPGPIQNEILRSDANVNSIVKMLLRRKGESDLWLEVMNVKYANTVDQFARYNYVSAVGVNDNGLPFAMFSNVKHQDMSYPGVELIVPKDIVMPEVTQPTRRR